MAVSFPKNTFESGCAFSSLRMQYLAPETQPYRLGQAMLVSLASLIHSGW
jgi:hypothetical protein